MYFDLELVGPRTAVRAVIDNYNAGDAQVFYNGLKATILAVFDANSAYTDNVSVGATADDSGQFRIHVEGFGGTIV